VLIGDINFDGATATAREITAAGGVAMAVHFDLAEPDSVAALVDTAASTSTSRHSDAVMRSITIQRSAAR
jgi:hypothetical protein